MKGDDPAATNLDMYRGGGPPVRSEKDDPAAGILNPRGGCGPTVLIHHACHIVEMGGKDETSPPSSRCVRSTMWVAPGGSSDSGWIAA
jgi:hypothetical protein